MVEKTISGTSLAGLLNVDRAVIARLAGAGVFKKLANGRYDERASLLAFIEHLRSKARERAPSAAQSEYQAAKAEELRLRVAERKRELIPLEDALGAVDYALGIVRSEFAGLPARITRDLTLRREIDTAIESTLSRVADRASRAAELCEAGNPLEEQDAPPRRRRRSNGSKD